MYLYVPIHAYINIYHLSVLNRLCIITLSDRLYYSVISLVACFNYVTIECTLYIIILVAITTTLWYYVVHIPDMFYFENNHDCVIINNNSL